MRCDVYLLVPHRFLGPAANRDFGLWWTDRWALHPRPRSANHGAYKWTTGRNRGSAMDGWVRRCERLVGRTTAAALMLVGVSAAAVTVVAQSPGTPVSGSLVAEPPGCWGPNGVDPDCLGPGPYGHGQWGPGPGTAAPGAMVGPGNSGPGSAESDPTTP